MTEIHSTCGVVLIDKPASWSSFDVIRVLRKQLGQKSIGHAGTLDPFATGLLVVAVGQATRALSHLLHEHKTYRVRVVFGVTSDTLDPEGVIERVAPAPTIASEQVLASLPGCVGSFPQMPPVYSAKKIRGKRACDRTRKGEIVELRPALVTCDEALLIDFGIETEQPFAGLPFADIRLRVGSGYYVRSFARDLGSALGTTAIATRLRREQVGNFHIDQALAPTKASPADIRPLTEADFQMPVSRLTPLRFEDFRHGRPSGLSTLADGDTAVFCGDRWVGFGIVRSGSLFPRVVISS